METIDMLINEIESEVLKAKKAAFSNTDIVVNKAVMLDLISRFRASYPLVLREATQIKKERDDIMQKAEAYANETMDKAEAASKTAYDRNRSVQTRKSRSRSHATRSGRKLSQDGLRRALACFQHSRQRGKIAQRRLVDDKQQQAQTRGIIVV